MSRIVHDLFLREEVSCHEFVDDEPLDAPTCRARRLEPVEIAVDYTDEDGRDFECVVALDDGRAAWVDAWDHRTGERVELDSMQREAIVAMACKENHGSF